jgi:Lipopolysaccharide kinase (Kdo/WaaP) family
MADAVWQTRGPWRLLIAPGREGPGFDETLTRLPFWTEKDSTPLAPPGRHRVDRVPIPFGDTTLDTVIKTFGVQAVWRDRLAARKGSKAQRAFETALALRTAGVGTPAPLAVVERWEGSRLRESRLVTAYAPNLTDFRKELQHIYSEAPRCTPLMDLLQCVADAVRNLHGAGILHHDLGNQNIALQRTPEGSASPWAVYFLDLNRAQTVPEPTLAQRGADLARIDLPSDFRRVFHAMLFHGVAPPAEFTEAEQQARKAFDRHTALRPWRHPFREARIRKREAGTRPPLQGRDIWIWDDRSAQAISAYTSNDRHKLLPVSNITAAIRSTARNGLRIRREYRALSAQSFQSSVPFAGTIGMTLDTEPDTWAQQLEWLGRLQGGLKIPLLLRLQHHQGFDTWQWTLDQALHLHSQGHSVALALVQDGRSLREPKGWRQMVTLAFDRAHTFADFFEIGHATNRSKWGLWDFRDYARLLDPVRSSLIQYPEARITGPACIDFEPHALASLLEQLPADLQFASLSHHLYVDRRGAPENKQGSFDTVAKCALLRAFARAYGFTNDRPILSEVNWPLQGTGPWSPVNSPYETKDPRTRDPSVSEEEYAAYMARYLLLTLASGHASRVYWWRLAARGFGLIDDTDPSAWRPRPAFDILQTLLAQVGESTFRRKADAPNGEYALEFTRPDGSPLTAHWSLTTPPEYT